jgi:hypothetical protein
MYYYIENREATEFLYHQKIIHNYNFYTPTPEHRTQKIKKYT